ncbi:MAG TPA: hypothetical protein VGL40_15550 [Bacillota bacterium]|jgi:hypothetical protein
MFQFWGRPKADKSEPVELLPTELELVVFGSRASDQCFTGG